MVRSGLRVVSPLEYLPEQLLHRGPRLLVGALVVEDRGALAGQGIVVSKISFQGHLALLVIDDLRSDPGAGLPRVERPGSGQGTTDKYGCKAFVCHRSIPPMGVWLCAGRTACTLSQFGDHPQLPANKARPS